MTTVSFKSTTSPKSISRSRPTKKMIIFDWDDTLFPTTHFLTNWKAMSITELSIWGCRVYKLLTKYIHVFGGKNIYIITNGIHGWIEQILEMASKHYQLLLLTKFNIKIDLNDDKQEIFDPFMAIHGLFDFHDIKLISARALFQSKFPNDPSKWKELAFIHYARKHFCTENKGVIISIGDHCDEWNASKNCQNFLNNLDKTKSFKFNLQRIKCKYQPTLNELIKEWDTLLLIADHLKLRNTSFDQCDLYLVSFILALEFNKKMKEISNSDTKKANIRENAVTFI